MFLKPHIDARQNQLRSMAAGPRRRSAAHRGRAASGAHRTRASDDARRRAAATDVGAGGQRRHRLHDARLARQRLAAGVCARGAVSVLS
jgi:hypothetical protein